MISYKYLGLLTRQFFSQSSDYLVLVAMRHEPKKVIEHWYQPHDQIKPLIEWAKDMNSKKFNIYACWASFREKKRTIEHMSSSAALVADWDGAKPKFLKSGPPTMVIQTSPGRFQDVYVHELQSGPKVGATYKRLAKELTGVDVGPSGDPVHLWRVPGFTNYPKPEKNRSPSPSKWDGRVKAKAKFDFTDETVAPKVKTTLPRWLRHAIDQDTPVGERSEQFHKVVCGLAKLNWSVEGIHDELKGTWAEDKFKGRLLGEIVRSFEKAEIPEPLNLDFVTYNPEDQETPITWLWFPYLPRSEVTLLDGDGGVGKTAMMLKVISCIINGGKMPNGQYLQRGHKAMFISTESNYQRVTLPALRRLGVRAPNSFYHVQSPKFVLSEEGIEWVRNMILTKKLSLVVIDPVAQFLPPSLEMNNYQHVLPLVASLQQIAEEGQCSIVIVRHNGKGVKTQLSHLGVGSVGWQSACRSQLVVRRDPTDEDQFVVAATKHQHASDKDCIPFVYEWKTIDNRGIIEWVGMSDLTDEQINETKSNKAEGRIKKKECEEWLREFLSERRSSTEIHTQAESRGFSPKVVDRVARAIGVQKSARSRRPDGGAGTITYWEMGS